MNKDRNKVRADTCGPLAQAVLAVRERGMISERWIETALIAALESHKWVGEKPGGLSKVGKTVAKLVYGKKDKDALAQELARVSKQVRVRDAVRRFFSKSGLEAHGVPVDHPGIGREELMAAMLGRFIYEDEPAYHRDELAHQGVYVLLQRAGEAQVNRSLLIIDSLGAQNVVWAAHLYRPVNIPDARLNLRAGVFLPHEARTALMSGARWINAGPLIRKYLASGGADELMSSVSDGDEGEDFEARELAILTLKAHGRAVMRIRDAGKEFGYVKLKGQIDPDVFTTLGLRNRDALSSEEAAVIPQSNPEHAQAYAEAQDALARFAAIAGASGLGEAIAAPAETGEPELAAGPADIPETEAVAITGDPSTESPPPDSQSEGGEDTPPAHIS